MSAYREGEMSRKEQRRQRYPPGVSSKLHIRTDLFLWRISLAHGRFPTREEPPR